VAIHDGRIESDQDVTPLEPAKVLDRIGQLRHDG
jgi:hypothetical protein